MSGTSYDGSGLDRAAVNEAGAFDASMHENQIVAMYDSDTQARAAYDTLVASGVPASAIQNVSKSAGTTAASDTSTDDTGVWGAIKSMFVPDEDRTAYSHAVGRGHAMLIVTPTSGTDRDHLIHTLESTDPVDLDAKIAEWKQAGYDTTAAHGEYTSATAATRPVGLGVSGVPGGLARTGTTAAVGDTDTIKVMEESLRVGKREVAAGAVRIRSYVVERPVEEQIRLREERVSIERTAVDRPATQADVGAFQERTIEARATSEEAVVSKEARVVEEIGLRKDASERTETVRDTVRKTEVEIDGDATAKAPGSLGTSTTGPVATPGATTSGANAPRR